MRGNKTTPRSSIQAKTCFQDDLESGHLAILDMPPDLIDLEPVKLSHALGCARDGILDSLESTELVELPTSSIFL